ncbi:MAG TPA: DUF2891 domain-containing protein [Rhizomicrobium sp.]|jgi:hypothetical protein|nr:DUF2891 domain-containing protein [Rhizomicrobium sp.]
MKLTPELASKFANVALGHVTREWPNKMDHVLDGPQDARGPRELHPIFFGSFDWHSCVHTHWLLARLYRRFPDLPEATKIRALLDSQFTSAKVAGEVAYLARPSARGFERPYGWGWALMLSGELARHQSEEGRRWFQTLQPLADAFVKRFVDFLPLATYPVRVGMHANTAFAGILALDYAAAVKDDAFALFCAQKIRSWYVADADVQPLEPSQADFLSPTLVEAACVAAVMNVEEFAAWFARYLPDARNAKPQTLFTPATVSDRSDGQIAHLDGLNLSRAWCWRLILDRLPVDAPLRVGVEKTIAAHLASAMDHIAGDYMGEHWLASFAALALDPHSA